MEFQPEKEIENKEDNLNKIIEQLLDPSQKPVNDELYQNELSRVVSISGFFTFWDYQELKSWVVSVLPERIHAFVLLSFIMLVITTFLTYSKENFLGVHIGIIPFLLFWLYSLYKIVCFFVGGKSNTFTYLGISVDDSSKNNKLKILSLFSVFLNNSKSDFHYTEDEKKKLMKEVLFNLEKNNKSAITSAFANVFEESVKKFVLEKEIGFHNMNAMKEHFNNLDLSTMQSNMLNAYLGEHLKVVPSFKKESLENTLLDNSNLDQEQIDRFVLKVFNEFKKQNFLYYPHDVDSENENFAIPTAFFMLFTMVVCGILVVSSLPLLAISMAFLPVLYTFKIFKNKKFLKKTFGSFNKNTQNKEGFQQNILAFSVLISLLLKSSYLNYETKEIKNEVLNKFFNDNFFDSFLVGKKEFNDMVVYKLLEAVEDELKKEKNEKAKKVTSAPKNELNSFSLQDSIESVNEFKKNMFFKD